MSGKTKKATDFLNNDYTPEHLFKLKNCGFLNSPSTKTIHLYNKNILKEMKVSVIINEKECKEIPSEKIFGKWDYLLITIFGLKFTINRLPKQKSSANDKCSEHNEIPTKFLIKKGEETYFSIKRAYLNKQEENCRGEDSTKEKNIEMDKDEISLFSYQDKNNGKDETDRLESLSCKTAILYIISQAYTLKMQSLLEDVSKLTLTDKKSIFVKIFLRCKKLIKLFIKILFSRKKEKKDYNKVLKEILDFKVRYLSEIPLETDRAYTTMKVWDELKKTFHLDKFISELDSKQKALVDYKRDEFQRKISKWGLIISLGAIILTGISAYCDVFSLNYSSETNKSSNQVTQK